MSSTVSATDINMSELRQLQSAVDVLSEGFAIFSSTDTLITCNSAFRHLFPDVTNYLRPGSTWSMFLREAVRYPGNNALQEIDTHLSNGLSSVLETQPARQGNRILQLAVHPLEDESFVVTGKDVAEQHRAHDMIEHAGDLLRDVMDACASRIAVSSIDDGRLLYATPAWKKTFGSREHLQETFVASLNYADLLTDILATGRVDDLDVSMRRTGKDSLPARLSARLIEYQDEPSMVVSAEDMTQLYRQRDEIVSTNQRLLDAIEALDQGFVLFDNQHKLVMANRHYRRVNAAITESLEEGVANEEIISAAVSNDHEPSIAGWVDSESSVKNEKYESSLADGRILSISRSITSEGGFLLVWTDVTDARRTEIELRKQREAAFQNEKLNALGQLLAGIAHELNNPLSVVVGHAMMLKDVISDEEALDGVERISRSAERCAKIVKTFLAMARQKPTCILDTDMNEVIANALEITAYGIKSKGIEIDLQLEEELPHVSCDEDQITQVLINLLINAEQALDKYSGETVNESRTIRLSTLYDSRTGNIITRVSDDGPGISADLRPRIFEPFFTTKSVNEGTGVGLALSHRIANSHNGRLELSESELGGATFTLSLPAATVAASRDTSSTKPAIEGKHRALVVEDESDVAHVMQQLLDRFGIDSIIVNNGYAALQQLEVDTNFSLILCDLRMPGMSGRQLAGRISDSWPTLKSCIIFVTGDAISDDADWIRENTDFPLLEKPVSPSELEAALHPVLIGSTDFANGGVH